MRLNPLIMGSTGGTRTWASAPGRVLALLALSFVLSWLAAVVYMFRFDVSETLDMEHTRGQDEWARHFTAEQGPRVIVTGGSSCSFSIDAETAVERFHVPVVNAGLTASFGSRGILLVGSRFVQSGDTLVLAIEPELMSQSTTYPQDVFRYLLTRWDWTSFRNARAVTGRAVPLDELIFAPRPGLARFAAAVGRKITGTPYRYATARDNPGGLMVTEFRVPLDGDAETWHLTPENRAMLLHFRGWASRQGVKLFYSEPWFYVDEANATKERRSKARFAQEMVDILPVLRDDQFGVKSDRSLFADTRYHLTEPAAQARTTELMNQVLGHQVWTPTDLAQAASRL